ncbi:MAG: outer membrane protein transport protein [Gammaproteobacteria bacterium]|nr:outer membrane protein transport protein [Gammaproteobacteria bacterium]
MTNKSLQLVLAAVSGALLANTNAWATNGMLMEGYGPESTAMGGASVGFENGAAGMINNPATLGMLPDNSTRLDISLGNLRPDVTSTIPTPQGFQKAKSGGDSYILPAGGFVKRKGPMSYGFGVFAQGGMGTEYSDNGPLQGARSEVSVGSLLAPLAYKVNDAFTLGGTLQYTWGGMDLIMGMPLFAPDGSAAPGTFADFSSDFGGSNVLGSASGTLLQGFGQLLQSIPQEQLPNHSAVFDFSNSSDFTGKASGAGVTAKLGMTWEVTPQATFGATYQAKTNMSDWDGKGTMSVINGADGSVVASFPGTYTVKDFQFPAVLTLGVGFKANDRLLLAMDVSQIDWSDTMSTFDLNFSTNTEQGPAEADVSMNQEWDDQTVVKIGAAYQANDNLTLRAGANIANNPVPDEYMNPLFPAIIENHYTAGFSYQFNKQSGIGASLVFAPEVKQTNSNTQVTTKHSQTNLQIMYSYNF